MLASFRLPLLAPVLAALLCACQTSSAAQAPRASSAAPATAGQAMVAAANPLAVEAGLKVLREGGAAIDAAIAVQTVLGLVEPQSSGLGGGAYMTYYDARTRKVTAFDGREIAPAAAGPDWFRRADGSLMPFPEAVRSGRSTGVPGVVAMLALAHQQHGKRPWPSLFGEAVRLADEGFTVSPRLAGFAARNNAPDINAYFTKADGTRIGAGDVLKNPAYAATVRRLAAEGAKVFYEGEIPAQIIARVGQAPNPATLTLEDFRAYRPKAADALCRPYRIYVVCVPPAPSGGPGVLEALGIFANTPIADLSPTDPSAWFLFAEGMRLMYADRDRYIADPAFVSVPTEGLLDPQYLAVRASLIGERAATGTPAAGQPRGAPVLGADATREPAGTSHFVVVDAQGNVLSMTTTVESPFGSGRMVGGFVLNNQLTDFSLAATDASGAPVANAVAAGKRPRSSMAPAIVLDGKGAFVMAAGSPGGNAIPAYNLKAMVGFLDWELPLQEAVNLPNLIARGAGTSAETSKFPPGVVEALAARGLTLRPGGGEDSGLHGVAVRNGRLEGAADPRREGVARAP